MLRHIAWFNEAPVAPLPEGGLTSEDVHVRERCLIPARAIEKLGVGCSVFGKLHDADPVHVSRHLQKLNTDIVVIGEISEPSRLRLARAAKHLGCYVVADFGIEEKDPLARAHLMQIVDQAVVSTEALAEKFKAETGKTAFVIPDCKEAEEGSSAQEIANLWLECFQHVKRKPAVGANTNTPVKSEN